MEISLSFDTTRKLMIKLFKSRPPDPICVCAGFRRHYVLRFLWVLIEVNLFEPWRNGNWSELEEE